MTRSANLPHLSDGLFITDGGLETTLVFHDGFDLPDFAAFPLLDDDTGRQAMTRYFENYLGIADRDGVGIVLDTPTWRANADWGRRLGYNADALTQVNRRAVEFVASIAEGYPSVSAVIDGVIGPRGDGYVVGEAMSVAEAADYHSLQTRAFAAAGVDLVSAVTMTYVDEAIGITRAARESGVSVVISFTVETDGRLPSGVGLDDAIVTVDEATEQGPAYYMINCAHPTHFDHVLTGEPWTERIKAVRANASRMSHDELDNAEALDRGDPSELAAGYVELSNRLSDLCVVGGCCGTDHEHISAISSAVLERQAQ